MAIEDVMHKKIIYAMNSEDDHQNKILQDLIEKVGGVDEVEMEVDATNDKSVLVTISFYTDQLPEQVRKMLDKVGVFMIKLYAVDMSGHAV